MRFANFAGICVVSTQRGRSISSSTRRQNNERLVSAQAAAERPFVTSTSGRVALWVAQLALGATLPLRGRSKAR